jgi:DNA-binding NarL/FixJ family response regulator
MLSEGLKRSIDESGIAKVTGTSSNLKECRTALAKQLPDILLLDVSLPDGNGVDFCTEIKTTYPALKVLILTTYNVYSVASRAMENGASGYILKNSLSEEVVEGIKTVMSGKIFLCDEINGIMQKRNEQQVWITNREQQLLRLLIEGFTNQEIGDKMCLSIETIKTYRKNLILKLGAKNSMVLVKMAIEQQLI